MNKLFALGYAFIVSSILTTLLIWADYQSIACVFSAITFGMCYSSMFPLLFALPNEYNLEVTSAQGALFMIFAAFG